jgi:hypothetical protein
MHTAAAITADALRQNVKDLSEVIFKIRALHCAGKEAPKAAARYVRSLRACHELREIGGIGPLFDLMHPTPINDQLVGFTAEQRKELEWKGVFASFPFPVAIPFHYSIAAE